MAKDAENKPDLSRLIGAIMEHPELIEEISHLADKSDARENGATEEEVKSTESAAASVQASQRIEENQRGKLLYALKPYLSEKRAKAIDSMLTFAEIFDMMKSKKQ